MVNKIRRGLGRIVSLLLKLFRPGSQSSAPIKRQRPSGSASEPIFVYQMGKVASLSIYNSLKDHGFEVHHAHGLNFPTDKKIPDGFEQAISYGKALRKKLFDSKIPLKIITITRDPVARNISAYFQNLVYFHKNINSRDENELPVLISTFIEKYEHDIPLTWFDREFGEVTGINIYDYEFPKEKGYLVINRGNIQVLIMNSELDDETKNSIIGEFVGFPDFKLERHNVTSTKEYAEFLRQIKLPNSYVENLLNSKYSKHFYGEHDLARFRKKWIREE
jgi:hypothetical protein